MACKNALLTDKKILDQEKVFFSLSLSLSLTHTHTLSLSPSLPFSLFLSLSLSSPGSGTDCAPNAAFVFQGDGRARQKARFRDFAGLCSKCAAQWISFSAKSKKQARKQMKTRKGGVKKGPFKGLVRAFYASLGATELRSSSVCSTKKKGKIRGKKASRVVGCG